jgi:hypothetical protein
LQGQISDGRDERRQAGPRAIDRDPMPQYRVAGARSAAAHGGSTGEARLMARILG